MNKKNKSKRLKILKLLRINAFVTFAWSIFAPFAVILAQDKGLNLQEAGLSWGLYSILAGVLMLVFSRYEDKLHRHSIFYSVGIMFLVSGSLVGAFFSQELSFYLVIVLYAIGFGFATPAFQTIYAKSQVKGEEAFEWAWMDGSNMLVMGIAAVLAGYIAANYGVNLIYLATLPFYLVALLGCIRIFKISLSLK